MNFNIILCVIYLYSCTAQVRFRDDYKLIESTKAYYKVQPFKLNFTNALAACAAEGSQLLVPTSEKELDEVLKMTTPNMDLFWSGVHDLYSEGDYAALYGIPFEIVFINWANGEPNNVGYENHTYDEDCIVYNRQKLSNDVPCRFNYYTICKKDVKGITRNEDCETYDPNYKHVAELDRCYKFHNKSMNWRDAYKICKAEESYLAIINNDNEAGVLVDLFAEHPESDLVGNFNKQLIHIGFNDLLIAGEYLTVKGQPLSETGYYKWAQNQPDNYQGVEHCGSMYRDGLLNDLNCDNDKALFVCEKELKELHLRFGIATKN